VTRLLETLLVALAFPITMLGVQRVAHNGKIGVNPLAAFTAAWWLIGCLYLLDPLELAAVPLVAQVAVAGSIACFTLGYLITCRPTGPSDDLEDRAGLHNTTLRPLAQLLCVTVVLGGVLFVVFVAEIGLSRLVSDPAGVLLSTRLALNGGTVPTGFYFFYFFELAVPSAAVLWYFRRRHRYLVIAILAGVALITTTGRTNVFTAIVWSTLTLLILRGPTRVARRHVLGGGAAAALSLVVFLTVGSALGKTFSNSALSHVYGGTSPALDAALPLYYLTGLLPTFGAITADPSPGTGGGLTFRPVLQVLNLLDPSIIAPSKIEQFHLIPTPFNLATYLAPLWHDGGMTWVLAGSALTGAACGFAFSSWRRHRSPASLLLAGFFTLVALNTIKDSSLNEMSTLMQVLLLVVCVQAERSARARDERDPSRTATARQGAK